MRAKLFLVVLLFSLASGAARAAEPWDTPFASDTRAQIKAARDIPVPDDQGVVVLLEQHKYVIDENGRTTFSIRKVYRIMKEDEIEDWSSIEQEYQPWHQSKPELRARVITEDGAVHWLDPKTIGDSPSTEYDANIFSDRRVARAPLPAIKPGAVIEYEIIVRETSPLLDAGEVRRIVINDGMPIQRFRLSIEAPSSVALKTIARAIPDSAIRRSSSGEKTQFECDWGPLSPRKNFEGNLPSNVPNFPYVAFSTGKSWQEIAARYEAIVDQQIRSSDMKPLLEGLDRTGGTLAIATRLVGRLHKEIRYTGVEFGESEIVPHTPEETQKRKYGDCKDKAALLVAMLRAAGLRASVALLDAGFGTDVDAELPGMGLFNHAIVFVEAEQPLWIDATSAETRVGQLPTMDQGRLALVASKRTTSLLLTPESHSSDNVRTDTIEFLLSDFGPGELHETIQALGSMETRMRQMYDGSDEKKVKESLERYLKRDYLAKSIGQFKVTKKDDFSESFHLRVEGHDVKRAFTEEDDAVAVLFPSLVFQELPYALTRKMAGASEAKEEPRKNDFVFNEPYVIELHYRIHPPAFFKVKDLPTPKDLKLGTAEYTRKYQTNPDGTVEALFRLDTGKRRLSPTEFTQLRLGLQDVYAASPELLTFVSEASEYVALGETRKALKLVSPDGSGPSGSSQVRLSRMLITAGAVNSAIRVARKIVDQDPASQQGWQSLAWAYQHDHFGRSFRGDWNAAEAEKCYRQALKIDPDDFVAKVNLAILLQYNADGLMYGKGSRLDESVQLYREILKTMPNPVVQQNVAVALLYAGHYAEAKEEVTKLPDTELHYVLLAVLTAVTDNSARAIIDSQTRIPDQRARVAILVGAGQTLGQLRQYDRALDLLKAAARLSNSHELQAHLDFLARMKRYDQSLVPETNPLYPVQQVLLEIYSPEFNFDALKAQFTKREDWAPLHENILRLRQHARAWCAMMTLQGLGPESILDAALSTQDFAKSPPGAENLGEDTHGFRFSGSSPAGPMPVMYVVRESGKYRILGTSKNPEEVGRRVLDLLAEKNVKGAQWWLDKVVPDLQPDRSDGAGGPAARFLWSGVTPETRGPEAISLAAASLIGPHSGSEQAIQTLREAHAKSSVQLVKAQIDLALCESLEKARKWDELMAIARRLAGIHLFEKDGFRFIVKAATARERWKELQAEAAQRAKSARQDSEALEALIISAIHNGDEGAAAASFTQLTQLPYAGPEELEFEAWASMLSGKPDADVLAKLGKNSELPELSTSAFWYALGMLQAVLNKPEEAQRSLVKALDQEDWETLDAKPWALAAKIYQQYGLEEEAAEAIAKARASAASGESAKWALSIVLPAAMVQAGKTVPGSKVQ